MSSDSGNVIDVCELVDRQRIGTFHFKLVFWLFLIMLFDGYDLSAGGLAVPGIARAWHAPPDQMRYFLVARVVGIMVGAALFGRIGDRHGRKTTILTGLILFAGGSIGCALAPNVEWLTLFRFLAGIGVGAVVPSAIALAADMVPRSAQAALIIVIGAGVTPGAALAGPIAVWPMARLGWPVLFWVSGIALLLVAALLALVLPESIKFLAQHGRSPERVAALARRIDPALRVDARDQFIAGGGHQQHSEKWLAVFRPPFTLVTALLASLYVIIFLVIYLMVSWMPQMIGQVSGSRELGVWAATGFSVTGIVGALILILLMGKRGIAPVMALFTCAVPLTAVAGFVTHSPTALVLVASLSGLCIGAVPLGLGAIAGIIYPTHIRSTGVSFSYGAGFLGAMWGPLLGGAMIANKLPVHSIFLVAAFLMAIGAMASYGLMRAQRGVLAA